jgi:hypothetical protein
MKTFSLSLILLSLSAAVAYGCGTKQSDGTKSPGEGGTGGTESSFYVFLLIGQSNMEGQPQPDAEDRTEDPRVKVLAYNDCPNLGRTYNE